MTAQPKEISKYINQSDLILNKWDKAQSMLSRTKIGLSRIKYNQLKQTIINQPFTNRAEIMQVSRQANK